MPFRNFHRIFIIDFHDSRLFCAFALGGCFFERSHMILTVVAFMSFSHHIECGVYVPVGAGAGVA